MRIYTFNEFRDAIREDKDIEYWEKWLGEWYPTSVNKNMCIEELYKFFQNNEYRIRTGDPIKHNTEHSPQEDKEPTCIKEGTIYEKLNRIIELLEQITGQIENE